MQKSMMEFTVGIFIIVGLVSFSYLAVTVGGVSWFEKETYKVKARFTSISGLKQGAAVEIAGVKIGKVESISFDKEDYEAEVVLSLEKGIKLQDDSIASIRTSGMIGDRFVNITPGGSEELIPENGLIVETESSISLEELISKYIFESGNK
ncbi:MAG: outer membrane lipid asymmetry maintenance protein MlaD [Gammaproteobacteria bacterium]|nr:outer membrane lipid asymmetry maintenance protein MlaD [Gammaproteobacteria bacterium]